MTRKLDDRDLVLLAAVRDEPRDADALAAALEAPRSDIDARLADLADNALVSKTDEDAYAITENGERILNATALGRLDDEIDTPPAVESAIEAMDLSPDREDAIRAAFTYLRYWGDATAAELVDAIYDEQPAGYTDRWTWWDEVVRAALAELPSVLAPEEASVAVPWHYDGAATVDGGDLDGRAVMLVGGAHPGDARHALETQGLEDAEVAAARAAFAALAERGTTTEDELATAVYETHPAGYDSPTAWWNGFLRDALAAVPRVERQAGRWRYDPA